MPTTCGFPNCKFRSRYRGSDDIRHFYRVPKKPSNLRKKWLEAIGRTEETIVSQLRVCSGHFEGGEKKEGDVPVSDPSIDKPVKVSIPPKISRTSNRGRKKREKLIKINLNILNNSKSSSKIYKTKQPIQKFISNEVTIDSILSVEKDNHFNNFMQKLLIPLLVSSKTLKNEFPTLSSSLKQMTNEELLSLMSSIFNNNRNHSPLSLNYEISTFKSQNIVIIIDDSPINWAFAEGILKPIFFPTIEEAIFKNKDLSEVETLVIWDNCDLAKESLVYMKNLRQIFKIGCGKSNIDMKFLKQKEIKLHSIISHSIDEVADNVLLIILRYYRTGIGNLKSIYIYGDIFKTNKPVNIAYQNIRQINSSNLGIIGGGSLSLAIANRARAFGFNVMMFDNAKCDEYKWNMGFETVKTIEHILQFSDCIVLNPPIHSSRDFTDQILMNLRPGSFIVDLQYNCNEKNLTALSPFLHSKHIVGYVQNYDFKAENINFEFVNYLLVPLTQTLSVVCLQKLRKSTVVEVQRYLKLELNKNRDNDGKKVVESAENNRSTSIESGFFSIKSLADN